ncbi:hypothetical protein DH2020_038156 [Rehmannia glutinosa]|uniref:RNA-binding protein AU-1/Ribonuclease E/G domain-containing protein n=1 Tax=Rehmannia glutinosa TaxID=99300 RepID=A0ABR0UZM0_REHGL
MKEIKFKCLVKEDMWTSSDVVWRPRVEFPMLAHSPSQIYRKRTAKLRSRTRRRPVAHLFHSWTGRRAQRFLISPLLRDDEKIVKSRGRDSLASKLFLNDCQNSSVRMKSHLGETFSIRDQVVEEPWLLQSSVDSPRVAGFDSLSDIDNEKEILKYSNGDIQKSKLLNQSRVSEDFNHKSDYEVNKNNSSEQYDALNESDKEQVTQSALNEQHQPIPENLLHEEESSAMTKEDYVSTVILINSSICTIQRIAVLENDKLVELLLEPVKTNVQCDSVYLGVVTKLVPHMGGAFVNIGSPRPSFMDIRPNREPFILPLLPSHMKEREVHGPIFNKSGEQVDFPENEAFSNGVEEPDEVEYDQSEDEFINDEFESHESPFHFDVLEVIKENGNGAVVRHDSEVDSQRFLEQLNGDVDQLQTESVHQDADVKVIGTEENKWAQVKKGSKIIVQVVKEGLGTKGPTLTAYPKLRSRFWVLMTRCNNIGISKKIAGVERTRLRVIAKTLQPPGFGLTVRTVASGHSLEELQKDLEGLLSTWKSIVDHAKSAALAADEGVDGAVPVMLHRAMGQTLSVVQDYFNEKVKSMVVDSPLTYHEVIAEWLTVISKTVEEKDDYVTNYLQEIAPNLCDRIELYSKRTPLFDEYNIEEEINNILSKRVPLANGGYLVIEQTEALVSIDVNGGHCMLGQGTSQEKAILEVNLAAAKQIARELRLRDIGGIIVVDFIDMLDDSNKRLVYEEVKKAVERDRSTVKVSELSRHGLMEITQSGSELHVEPKKVRPSVTFMISEPCTCCHATGRVEALDTSFSKIEHEICRLLDRPRIYFMLQFVFPLSILTVLSFNLVARGLSRGTFELKLLTDENMDKNQQQGAAISVLRPKEVVTYSPTRKVSLFPIKKWKAGGKS